MFLKIIISIIKCSKKRFLIKDAIQCLDNSQQYKKENIVINDLDNLKRIKICDHQDKYVSYMPKGYVHYAKLNCEDCDALTKWLLFLSDEHKCGIY